MASGLMGETRWAIIRAMTDKIEKYNIIFKTANLYCFPKLTSHM